ncbi:MAG: tRNA lysidine(34) synthetase TilS [Planctomycetota bacterium]|nr:tRNA lysidine(34) synthetase TilS [Planctomycetota bacterium]
MDAELPLHEGELIQAIRSVPSGRWAVGVSGGADSVALLLLLRERTDIVLHVVHLDHQLRGAESDQDARFVAALASESKLFCTIARRDQLESQIARLPRNPSARYRALRTELFRQVIAREKLEGVAIAHHADDQAETVLLRLMRGSGATAIGGMAPRVRIGQTQIIRPLLDIRGMQLRQFLIARNQDWREDTSNQSENYARNRVRKFLRACPALVHPLCQLGDNSRKYTAWARTQSPQLASKFAIKELARLPRVLARQSARRWLLDRATPPSELNEIILDRLCQMASDAATTPRQDFPGSVHVYRQQGTIGAK